MSEEDLKLEEEKVVDSTEESISIMQEALGTADGKWTKQMQKQQYNQYLRFIIMNKKRGAKRKRKSKK